MRTFSGCHPTPSFYGQGHESVEKGRICLDGSGICRKGRVAVEGKAKGGKDEGEECSPVVVPSLGPERKS